MRALHVLKGGGGRHPVVREEGRGRLCSPPSPNFFLQQALQIFKDDVNGFSSPLDLDISYMVISSFFKHSRTEGRCVLRS